MLTSVTTLALALARAPGSARMSASASTSTKAGKIASAMAYRPLGSSGITVSECCLGTMTWGSQNTDEEAFEQLEHAWECGVNFLDTAEGARPLVRWALPACILARAHKPFPLARLPPRLVRRPREQATPSR
jgi:hypothetical protein